MSVKGHHRRRGVDCPAMNRRTKIIEAVARGDRDEMLAIGKPPEFYRLSGIHDPVSALRHLLGAAVFVALGFLLLRRGRGSASRLTFLAIYAIACVVLLLEIPRGTAQRRIAWAGRTQG